MSLNPNKDKSVQLNNMNIVSRVFFFKETWLVELNVTNWKAQYFFIHLMI